MAAALIGFFGIVIGLAIGRGYGFWAERRSELAEAAVAAAVLAEGLRQDKATGGSDSSAAQIWTDHRRRLVVHLSPRDYRKLADAVKESAPDAQAPLRGDDLIKRLDALHALFWEEHEVFLLVPLARYLRGDTVSKRIREILDPERNIDALPPRGERSPARTWHSPSEQPTRTLDPQDPAAPE
ncbi:MAG: hypothetical protein ACTHNP_10295 [Solirubrobacterales bacterium]